MFKFFHIIGLIALLFSLSFCEETTIKNSIVFDKSGKTSTIKGKVKGYDTAVYTFEGKTAQKLKVHFNGDTKSSNYFNILPPGEETYLFNSSISGDTYIGNLPRTGEYRIVVYLMRNDARRNKIANFSFTAQLLDDPKAPKQTIYPNPPIYHDASAPIDCTMTASSEKMICQGIVVRDYKTKSAQFWIKTPIDDDYSRTGSFSFSNNAFSNGENKKIDAQRKGDNWYLNFDKRILYVIPDAFLYGG